MTFFEFPLIEAGLQVELRADDGNIIEESEENMFGTVRQDGTKLVVEAVDSKVGVMSESELLLKPRAPSESVTEMTEVVLPSHANALGTIFEQETGRGIFEAFHEEIAEPLGMVDFRVEDGEYWYDEEKSLHPFYRFFMTAHDMALYGLLYMNDGTWNGEQIVPAEWIAESTRLHSMMTPEGSVGYGYLWNVISEDVGLGRAYFHGGAGVHLLAVFQDHKLVVVHRVDTLADDVRFTPDDLNRLFDLLLAPE